MINRSALDLDFVYAEVPGRTVHFAWRPSPGGSAEVNCHRQRGQSPHCK